MRVLRGDNGLSDRDDFGLHDLLKVSAAAKAMPAGPAIALEIDRIAQRLLGHRFLTIMRLNGQAMELERVYTSHPVEYPIGGRKVANGTAWADRVLLRGEVLLGSGPKDLEREFEDHHALLALGLGSVINTPVLLGGRCLGTLNMFHKADWYRPEDANIARALSYLLVPALTEAGTGGASLNDIAPAPTLRTEL